MKHDPAVGVAVIYLMHRHPDDWSWLGELEACTVALRQSAAGSSR